MTISGTYAYRFSGFAVVEGIACSVVGIGTMDIDTSGNITGNQTSSATQLKGDAAVIEVGTYSLAGTVGAARKGSGAGALEATITFTMTWGNGNGPAKQTLKGTFSIVPCGGVADPGEKFWLISTGAREETQGVDADEVVSGEAIRIAAA